MNQILKYDKNTIDTDKKLADIDSAFVEIEKIQETQDQTINDLLNRLEPLKTDFLKTDVLEEKTVVLLETEEKTDVLLEKNVLDIKFDLKNAVSEEFAMASRF